MYKTLLSASAVVLGMGLALAAPAAEGISETAVTGPYTVTLKVLPAESFTGPKAAMTWDAGASAVDLDSAANPNHHVVAFVERDGRPVESATVTIRYRRAEPGMPEWTMLPVARMHVSGKSLATTHYGNNVRLEAGHYTAEVTVDGSEPALFHFNLPPSGPSSRPAGH